MRERLGAGGRSGSEPRPAGDPPVPPGNRPLVAVIVLTGLVLAFAAGVAFWMYWLQGWLPY